jgi:hypothetical protein
LRSSINMHMLMRPIVDDAIDGKPLHLLELHQLSVVSQVRSNSHTLPSRGKTMLNTANVQLENRMLVLPPERFGRELEVHHGRLQQGTAPACATVARHR